MCTILMFFVHLFFTVLSILHDNRGEWKLPDEKQNYTVNGVTYSVSPHYLQADPEKSDLSFPEDAPDLYGIFARLVKIHAVLLTEIDVHDTIVSEPVPAATKEENK